LIGHVISIDRVISTDSLILILIDRVNTTIFVVTIFFYLSFLCWTILNVKIDGM
jgi:hypothetical protein